MENWKINIDSYIHGTGNLLGIIESFSEDYAKICAMEQMLGIVTVKELISGIDELENLFSESLEELYNRALNICGYKELESFLLEREGGER